MKKILFALFLLAACSEEDILDPKEEVSVENEAVAEAYFEDTEDMATVVVSSESATFTGAKTASNGRDGVRPNDHRFECATITLEFKDDNTNEFPHGFIIVDFGDSCEDERGNVRTGTIIIEFEGRRFLPGSKITTSLQDYTINGIELEGIRTVINAATSAEDNPKFTVALKEGKVTWPDETFATREVFRTREWVRQNNPSEEYWIVSQTAGKLYAAAGTNRRGNAYQVEITTPLVYKRSCAISNRVFMAVEGVKVLTTENKQITIDYGNGACDNRVMVTVEGKSDEIEIGE